VHLVHLRKNKMQELEK